MEISATVKFNNNSRLFVVDNFFDEKMVRKLTALFSNVNSDWEDGDNYGHSPGRLIYNGKSKTVDECFNYCSKESISKTKHCR